MSEEHSDKHDEVTETGQVDNGDSDNNRNVVIVRAPDQSLPLGAWIVIMGALATVGIYGMEKFAAIIAPAFLALTLVLTIRPIHRWLIRKGVPPWLSAIGTIIVLISVLGAIVGLTILAFLPLPRVISSYQNNFEELTTQVLEFLQANELLRDQGFLSSDVNELLKSLDLESIFSWVMVAFDQISSILGLLAVLAMSVFFIVVDTLTLTARSKIVEDAQPMFHEALSGFEGRVRQYWLVASIFGAIVAVFDWIALQAMGIPLAMAWALVSFLTNYIPNVGFVLGLIPPALFGLLEGGWQLMVWVIVAYSLINFIIQSLLQPKFTADAVGLSATVTFLSLLIWAVVLGPLGALLAVPVTLFFKAILVDSSPKTRWIDAFLTSEADVRRKQETGKYIGTDHGQEVLSGIQTAVEKATRSILGRGSGSEKDKDEEKPKKRRVTWRIRRKRSPEE